MTSPFDAMAVDYDRRFGASLIGARMRRAVWGRLDARFGPGDRVLELNCGTGADAIHLARRGVRVLATDAAPAMLEVTRGKVVRAGLEDVVEVQALSIEALKDAPSPATPFDGALSNFGGLNCVADLPEVAAALAARLRPGALALLCIMGPLVPWEWGWYLWRGEPRRAFRRLRRGGTPWRGLTIRYPSPGAARRAFAPGFRLLRASALGALLPPPYVEQWATRHGRLLDRLDRWERRLETWPPLPWLADHYLLEMQRV